MKAIVIEVSGGSIIQIAEVTDAPKEGILIIDHDNIEQNIENIGQEAVQDCLENFYQPDNNLSYEEFKKQIEDQYK